MYMRNRLYERRVEKGMIKRLPNERGCERKGSAWRGTRNEK